MSTSSITTTAAETETDTRKSLEEGGFSVDEQIDYVATTALTTRSSDSSSQSSSEKLEPLSTSSFVLHEATHHKFNRTKSGRVFEKDLKDIFSLLIISLNLKRNVTNVVSLLSPLLKFNGILTKKYPYTFSIDSAIESMKDLKLTIELSSTITRISYSFKPEMSKSLISQFYKAKFLHSPADRTRSNPKANVSLQPTPKGLAIVQDFCERLGMATDDYPEILTAIDFNTMSLFKFERDLSTDKILYSEYFLHLLFNLLMGPKPNIWTASNKPDPLPETSLISKDKYGSFNKNLSKQLGDKQKWAQGGFSFANYQSEASKKQNEIDEKSSDNEPVVISSFYHRYFTNPESEAHIQYYVSSVGVRLLREKEFTDKSGKTITADYCISGKAICQWILDCTDILNPKHAYEIAALLLKSGLIVEVLASGDNVFAREKHYKLTRLGLSISQWEKYNSGNKHRNLPDRLVHARNKATNLDNAKLTLEDVLNDPGMRFQFRKHLNKEYCIENLEAYNHLMQFEKKYCLWKKLNLLVENSSVEKVAIRNSSVENHMRNLVASCISIAYQIFNTYLSDESPLIVNIDFKLRSKITQVMIVHNPKGGAERDDESIKYLDTPTEDDNSPVITPIVNNQQDNVDLDMDTHLTAETNLKEIAALLSQVRLQVYRLMEVDSIPKFLGTLSNNQNLTATSNFTSLEEN